MTRVVKRSGSRVLYALGVLICVALTVEVATIALRFYHLTQDFGPDGLPEIIQLELREAWLQVIFAALITLRYADRLWAVTRLDRRRQAAARGEGRTISRELELRSLRPTILTPPTTLRLRMAWRSKQMVFLCLALFLIFQVVTALTLFTMSPLRGCQKSQVASRRIMCRLMAR